MEIKAVIKQRFNSGKSVKAYADIIIDGAFAVHGLAVIEKDSETRVSMPRSHWVNNNGEKRSRVMCHPVLAETSEQTKEAVLAAYNNN